MRKASETILTLKWVARILLGSCRIGSFSPTVSAGFASLFLHASSAARYAFACDGNSPR